MFGIYTKITTISGKSGELLNILLQAAKAMETIETCKLYLVNESATEKDIIWVTEVWDSKESHATSLSLEINKKLIAQGMLLIAKTPKQIVLNSIGGKGI